MAQNKDNCVIYARVSSREQEDTGYSLDAQIGLLKEHSLKRGYSVTKLYRVAESASKWQIRKTLGEMLEFCDKNGVNVILCEKIDRLTRSNKDAAIVDDWVRAVKGREVDFVKESFVLSQNTKAHDNFVWDMKVATARFYTNNLSEEVKKGQAEKIRQGWLPTKPPLGYKTIGDKGHKTHVLDSAVSPLLKRAFQAYASGSYSLSALGDKLFEEGLRTRGGYRLSKARLHEILGDPFYYGAMRWNDITYTGRHEPLIPKATFDAVQEIMTGKSTPHHKRRLFSFSKMMHCGECGGTISGEIHKGHTYYYCKHNKTCPQRGGTREEDVEKQLMGVFHFFERLNTAEADEIYNKIKADHQSEADYKKTALEALHKRYDGLQRRLDILYDDRLDERITQVRWEEKQREINTEQSDIQAQIDRLKSEETRYFELYINILDLARRAREIYEKRTPEERRLLLSHIFSNLTLKDKKTTYMLRKPVAALAARVQQQLDAQKDLEPSINGLKQGANTASGTQLNSKLRG